MPGVPASRFGWLMCAACGERRESAWRRTREKVYVAATVAYLPVQLLAHVLLAGRVSTAAGRAVLVLLVALVGLPVTVLTVPMTIAAVRALVRRAAGVSPSVELIDALGGFGALPAVAASNIERYVSDAATATDVDVRVAGDAASLARRWCHYLDARPDGRVDRELLATAYALADEFDGNIDMLLGTARRL